MEITSVKRFFGVFFCNRVLVMFSRKAEPVACVFVHSKSQWEKAQGSGSQEFGSWQSHRRHSESASWPPSHSVVPIQSHSLVTQEKPTSQPEDSQAGGILHYWCMGGGAGFFVLFRPSANCIPPTHLREGNLLCSVYRFKH
jgi:hypothetical protein